MTRDAQHAPSRGGPAEQHLAASLELFERLAKERGPVSGYAALRALLAEGPAAATSRDVTLKYDFYLGRQQGGAWGLTINDAHEGAAHARDVLRFARALGQGYRLGALQTLAQRVREADVSLTFAVGFDAPDRPARLKFYFQERTWNAGVLRWAGLTPLLAELVPGFELPRFVAPTRSVGVVAIDLTPAGGVAAKVYLGHSNLGELCAGAPTEVGALADDMARVCPMPGQFYYLTVRARSGEAPSYSINKIYDVAALVNAERSEEAWLDASGLFDLTGDRTAFDRLRAMTHGLLAIPTATALDQRDRERDRERDRDCSQSADLYVAAIRPD